MNVNVPKADDNNFFCENMTFKKERKTFLVFFLTKLSSGFVLRVYG